MNKKWIILVIGLVIIFSLAFFIKNLNNDEKVKNLKALVLSSKNKEVTVQDNNDIIYTPEFCSLKMKKSLIFVEIRLFFLI